MFSEKFQDNFTNFTEWIPSYISTELLTTKH